jgi:hypothetical protein
MDYLSQDVVKVEMDYLQDHAIITCFVEDKTSYLVFNAWITYLNQRMGGGNMVFD